MAGVKDSSGLYEVERRAHHDTNPGYRSATFHFQHGNLESAGE